MWSEEEKDKITYVNTSTLILQQFIIQIVIGMRNGTTLQNFILVYFSQQTISLLPVELYSWDHQSQSHGDKCQLL